MTPQRVTEWCRRLEGPDYILTKGDKAELRQALADTCDALLEARFALISGQRGAAFDNINRVLDGKPYPHAWSAPSKQYTDASKLKDLLP